MRKYIFEGSRSTLDTYVHTHAYTDMPTYRITPPHTHTHTRTNKTGKIPKPMETRISRNQKVSKIGNLKTIMKTRKTRISTRTLRQICKKSSQQKIKQFPTKMVFSPRRAQKHALKAQRMRMLKQTCTQFLAVVIECGDIGERMHGKMNQG